jgi:hypothetical protein
MYSEISKFRKISSISLRNCESEVKEQKLRTSLGSEMKPWAVQKRPAIAASVTLFDLAPACLMQVHVEVWFGHHLPATAANIWPSSCGRAGAPPCGLFSHYLAAAAVVGSR